MSNFLDAVADASAAIALDPRNAKAFLKKGVAAFSLDEFETALEAFHAVAELDPSEASCKMWIRKCKVELGITEPNPKSSATAAPTTRTSHATAVPTTPSSHAITTRSGPIGSEPIVASKPADTNTNISTNTDPSSNTPANGNTTPAQPTAPSVVTTPTPTPTPTPAPVFKPIAPKKYDWYQNATHVVIEVFQKKVQERDVSLDVTERHMDLNIKLPEGREFTLDINLWGPVISGDTTRTVMQTKVEIKLKKQKAGQTWASLEPITAAPKAPSHPGTSKDWDKIVNEGEKDEDKPTGDAALQAVFQQIFANGSEEQRRAMVKSFTESGGTVLSTNWEEVGKGHVKGSPPPGQEMHKWGDD